MVAGVDFETVRRALADQIGHVRRKPLGRVSALQFARFAFASAEQAGRYVDDAQARAEGLPSTVAPPLFLSAVMSWELGPPEHDLRADGLGEAETDSLPLDGLRIMGAGQELEFFHPVVDGLAITEEAWLENVRLKQGRSGTLLIYTLTRTYVDEDGRELVRCRENFIGR